MNRIDQTKAGITACYQANGIFTQQVYQPLSRFWLFQGIETLIFLALAAGLVALAFWCIRRRIQN